MEEGAMEGGRGTRGEKVGGKNRTHQKVTKQTINHMGGRGRSSIGKGSSQTGQMGITDSPIREPRNPTFSKRTFINPFTFTKSQRTRSSTTLLLIIIIVIMHLGRRKR
jgi:hypothetical protein